MPLWLAWLSGELLGSQFAGMSINHQQLVGDQRVRPRGRARPSPPVGGVGGRGGSGREQGPQRAARDDRRCSLPRRGTQTQSTPT